MISAPGIDEIRAAAERIHGLVRRTPLLAAAPARESSERARRLLLKLESLQVTGSFKARGAISKLGTLSAGDIAKGLVTASGGNHGLAIAYAGWLTGRPAGWKGMVSSFPGGPTAAQRCRWRSARFTPWMRRNWRAR